MEKYYLIWDSVLGKRINHEDFIYKDGQWVRDDEFLIADRLVGYDPSEPPDSPYAIYNRDIMSEMITISEQEAKKIMSSQK